jgi:hypothetical protein
MFDKQPVLQQDLGRARHNHEVLAAKGSPKGACSDPNPTARDRRRDQYRVATSAIAQFTIWQKAVKIPEKEPDYFCAAPPGLSEV